MNPFQKIKNKIEADSNLKNEAQRQRIERLEQLEAAQNRKGFHIPNPVQSMKDKKEIKHLKKEIAAFEESKRNTKVVIGCVALVAVLICFCVMMSLVESPAKFDGDMLHVEDYQEPLDDYQHPSTSVTDPTWFDSQNASTTESAENQNDGGGFFDWLNEDLPEFEFELSSDGKSYALVDYNYLSPEASDCVTIPAIYEDLPVTEIASQAFYACDKLKSVIIPEGIIEIGSYAFYHCSGLENISFPTTLRRIKEYAFEGCDSISSVEIPWAINIGFRAFCECESLNAVVIGNLINGTSSIDEYAFYQCKKLESATLEGCTTIDGHAFAYCENLKTVQVSQDLIKIGDSAFEYCQALETIYFIGTPEDYNIDYWPWWNKDTGNYEEVFIG